MDGIENQDQTMFAAILKLMRLACSIEFIFLEFFLQIFAKNIQIVNRVSQGQII